MVQGATTQPSDEARAIASRCGAPPARGRGGGVQAGQPRVGVDDEEVGRVDDRCDDLVVALEQQRLGLREAPLPTRLAPSSESAKAT